MVKKIVFLDNFDSFTYNLVQMFSHFCNNVEVYRNNELGVDEILSLNPTVIVYSPGPGRPEEAGIMPELIKQASDFNISQLGICLGHQCLAQVFGAKIVTAQEIVHGKTSKITHCNHGIFQGLPTTFQVVRYHSLAIKESSLPKEFEVTARTIKDNEIMGIRHLKLHIEGVQFHPESVLSEHGFDMIKNFLDYSFFLV